MFEFTPSEKGLVIRINTKRFDATNTEKFKGMLEEHCAEAIEEAVVYLGEVEFIDSSGIGALLSVQKRMKNGMGAIKLMGAQPSVESIINLLRLQRVFEIEKKGV